MRLELSFWLFSGVCVLEIRNSDFANFFLILKAHEFFVPLETLTPSIYKTGNLKLKMCTLSRFIGLKFL